MLHFDNQFRWADSLYWCWITVVTSIYPGPVTFVIRSVSLYILITLNVDVLKLIDFLLATHKERQLEVLLDICDVIEKRNRLWAKIASRCFCLPGNYINRTLFLHVSAYILLLNNLLCMLLTILMDAGWKWCVVCLKELSWSKDSV